MKAAFEDKDQKDLWFLVHHYPFITRNYAVESQLSIEVIPPPKMLSKMYKHLSIYPRSNCSLIDFFNTCLTVLKGFLQICNTSLKRLLEATEQKCVRHTSAAELHYASGKSILSNRLLTQQPSPFDVTQRTNQPWSTLWQYPFTSSVRATSFHPGDSLETRPEGSG